MSPKRNRHFWTLVPICAVLAFMLGLTAYSPTLYRLFCEATGYEGTVRRAPVAAPVAQASDPDAKTVTVSFDSNVANGLPWEFRPEQRKVTVKLGEPTQVYYYAKNNSDRTIVARAVFNVTPEEIAAYFFKIECFCFTNEKLKPGESARMPLVFYVDKEADQDGSTKDIQELTLSYTFYPQNDLTPDQVASTRDLGTGSQEKESELAHSANAAFQNDAPRR
jgi:cytochrome c oxidase assembly protein subunit 11